ncbi:MAG: VWA domain-containing protein [Bryobacteraceae bacterium]
MSIQRGGWICLFGFSLFLGLAQQSGPARQPAPAASVQPDSANHRIGLDVVVTDKSARPLPGLQQEDFTLLDNKLPQKIVSFQAAGGAATTDPPVEVILLVDAVNISFSKVTYAREEIKKFLLRNGGELPLPVSVAYLSDSGMTMDEASRDGNALIAGIDKNKNALRTIGSAQGFYGATDRQKLSIRGLGQLVDYGTARPGRKLVVWISPGWPLLTGPGVELSSKDQQGFFKNIVAVSDGLRRARITLYHIDPLGMADAGGVRTSYYKAFLKGVRTAKQVELADLSLQVLAVQSGGRVLNTGNDVAGEIATCIADANAFYVLSFDGLAGDGPNEYHALEVKIDKPGLTARTRSGYYAQPEPAR